MVSFLQKNAAKIVIISGAALISTISGGGCDDAECTQDSTLSAKCNKSPTAAQTKKCTDVSKVVSTEARCKGTTCADTDYGDCCVTAPPKNNADTIVTCATDGTKDTAKKCSLAACPTATPYRVKIATGTSGCLAICTAGDKRQTKECACVELDTATTPNKPKSGGIQNLCAKDHICKATGVVEFPVCALGNTKYNSNCYYGSGATKTTLCTGWSDGASCTDTVIGDNEIAVTDFAVCKKDNTIKKSDANSAATAVEAAKVKICAKNEICKIGASDAASCVAIGTWADSCGAAAGAGAGDSKKVMNCVYATKSKYCGKRHGVDYAWDETNKRCADKCAQTGTVTANKSACVCVNDGAATPADKYGAVESCEATKLKCDNTLNTGLCKL